jgi:hypothetical protein
MKGEVYQVALAGGLETRLPQAPESAGRAENLRVDRRTGGWSTRVGYEPYMLAAIAGGSWLPYTSANLAAIDLGPVYSLHVAQMLGGGGRQHTLFEADGSLYLQYEAAGAPSGLLELASGRIVPTPTQAASWYTDTPYGTVITNGVNRPIIVNPWPLDDFTNAVTAVTTDTTITRPLGYLAPPTAIRPHRTRAVESTASPPITPDPPGGDATTIWMPSQARAISDGGRWGLGLQDNSTGTDYGAESKFGWAVSFISSTGSESPASSLAVTTWQIPPGVEGYRYAVALDVPLGPAGTVARKLYRTANFADDRPAEDDTTLYFLDFIRNNVETLYIDATRTPELGAQAPDIPIGPLPAPLAQFSALFQGCLWLDGGRGDGRTLYYSNPGLIEQFRTDSFIELSSQGGNITGLFANYNSLLVFRERSIDVVTGDFAAGFSVATLAFGVTCQAPHSIASVPGLGVVFLALDGVYAITGGQTGGAINDLIKLTSAQDEVIERITRDCHPKAVGAYSAELREYHVYFPVDGNDRPNLGLVLHVDRLNRDTSLSAWSIRDGFPVGALASRYDGSLVFGHNTGTEDSTATSVNRGLFVISGRRSAGVTYDAVGQAFVYNGPLTSVYRSAWFDFGDAQIQKQVNYVTLWMITTGEPTITMRHFKDFDLTPVEERTYKAQPPDATALPVFGTVVLDAGATYKTERLVPLRFSVAHMSAAWFCFEFETTEDLILVGFEYEYTSKGTRVVAGVRA